MTIRHHRVYLPRVTLSAALVVVATIFGVPSAAAAPLHGSVAAPTQSLQFEREPLARALAELARAANVSLSSRGHVPNVGVSGTYSYADFRLAVRRLLADQSYLLIEHGARTWEPSHRRARFELLFLSTGNAGLTDASSTVHAPAQTPASTAELQVEELAQGAEHAVSAEERAAALDALAYRAVNGATEIATAAHALDRALADADERVRHQALTTLKDTADQLPLDSLRRMVREDVNPAVRTHALELLVERATDDAGSSLRAALADSEVAVRERARELVKDWHMSL